MKNVDNVIMKDQNLKSAPPKKGAVKNWINGNPILIIVFIWLVLFIATCSFGCSTYEPIQSITWERPYTNVEYNTRGEHFFFLNITLISWNDELRFLDKRGNMRIIRDFADLKITKSL